MKNNPSVNNERALRLLNGDQRTVHKAMGDYIAALDNALAVLGETDA